MSTPTAATAVSPVKPNPTTATATTTTAAAATAAGDAPSGPSSSSVLRARSQNPALAVALGEAALDSPTFRALTVHFAEQVDGVERWLDGYVRSTSKLVGDMAGLEDSINTYLARMAPPTTGASLAAADAVIDVDYTLLALRRAGDGARDWWTQILTTVRRLEGLSADPIRSFMNNELRGFKDARRALEATQKTFDTALVRYAAQSRAKEPSALREDAFAVYETRKAYLKASMDFCQLAPQLRFSLDKLLVRACADIYREMRRGRGTSTGTSTDNTTLASPRVADEMDRLRGWTREMEASEAVFRRELQIARRDLGETTLATYRPSRELDDYNTSTVPFLGSRGGPTGGGSAQRKNNSNHHQGASAVLSEKQGWLFLRVQSGKPVRTSWVRRWYYCRDGVLGWLVQGPHGVLQGDEIGVLLCSVKPAVQEERRFCFEVKTKVQNLLLQAETQAQLMEWLEVFEVAKKKAMEASMGRDQSTLPGGIDPAFAVMPPSVPEFSAKILEGLGAGGGGGGGSGGGDEEGRNNIERSGTLPIPGQDGHLTARASFDVSAPSAGPRRAVTSLGREEGESSRDHAARLMQKLDLHRKGTNLSEYAAGGGGGVGTGGGAGAGSGVGNIASLIAAGNNFLPGYAQQQQQGASVRLVTGTLAPMTMAKPPVPTSLSRAAVFASGERALGPETGRRMSSAVMANYWGTNSWASVYASNTEKPQTPQLDSDEQLIATVLPQQQSQQQSQQQGGQVPTPPTTSRALTPVNAHRKTLSADTKITEPRILEKPAAETFPPQYPPELRAQHAQFRLLFPAVSLEEKLVLVFNAAWASAGADGRDNAAMAGNGRVFVTPDNMYFYGHQMGLVMSYRISLDIITEVTAAPGRDCDFVFLHLGQDMNDTGFTRITLKIFLGDLELLHSRLNLLVDDLQAEEPMDLQEIVTALGNLEKEVGEGEGEEDEEEGEEEEDDEDGGEGRRRKGRGRGRFDKKSPSVESWEEVSSNTPIDNGTASGRPVVLMKQRVHGLGGDGGGGKSRAGGRGGGGGRTRKQPLPKLQLPTNPVIFEPEGMGASVTEKNYEISAKACFHVLFGDKSFVFPKLYFERRAREITQGPWELGDHGVMRRVFKFKVDAMDLLGRARPGDVTDTQTIEVFNDHITYVVTHSNTPWHLPYSQSFRIVSKMVITHVAKSKCKLAIFTRAEWSRRAPPLSKSMVERQALNDAANDAEDLAEIATDQVRKLGPHSRTKRAIQVYGNIGQQTQTLVFTPNTSAGSTSAANAAQGPIGTDGSRQPAVRPRTLTAILLETGRSLFESAVTSVMMWTFAFIRRALSIVRANWVILALLAVSAVYNVVVTSQGGAAWWAERRAARYMSRIGVGPNTVMSKALYLTDLEEALRGTAAASSFPRSLAYVSVTASDDDDDENSDSGGNNSSSTMMLDSPCYTTFQALVNATDLDAPYQEAGALLATPTSRAAARRLRRTRQRLGAYRHDLVVAMRVVNGVEAEVLRSEWENWLLDEGVRCEQVGSMLRDAEADDAGSDGGEEKEKAARRREALRAWHVEYCGSCEAERRAWL